MVQPAANANRRVRRALAFAAVACALAVGCQLIVSDEVPEFRCAGSDPSACPAGLVCDTARGRCIASTTILEGGADARPDAPSGDGGEAGTRRADLGEPCVLDLDCNPDLLCGTSTVLTTAVVPTSASPICTKPCCTSEDCPASFVCFPASTGGNYCVAATTAGRPSPPADGKSGGTACGTGAECRSGLCLGRCANEPIRPCGKTSECDGGTCTLQCADSCCGSSDCAPGSDCRLTTIAEHLVWGCGLPNGPNANNIGETCAATIDCKNDNCAAVSFTPTRRCTPTCCSARDCAAAGGPFARSVCLYGGNGADRVKWCFAPNPNAGFCQGRDAGCEKSSDCDSGLCVGANGTTCTMPTDCISRYCDVELRKCASPCCTDGDCASDEICRPSRVDTPFLRCIPRP